MLKQLVLAASVACSLGLIASTANAETPVCPEVNKVHAMGDMNYDFYSQYSTEYSFFNREVASPWVVAISDRSSSAEKAWSYAKQQVKTVSSAGVAKHYDSETGGFWACTYPQQETGSNAVAILDPHGKFNANEVKQVMLQYR